MSETYSIEVECRNCDKSGKAQIERGTPVPDEIECPNCGCKTAKKKRVADTRPIYGRDETLPWDRKPIFPDPVVWQHEPEIPPRDPSRKTFPVEMQESNCVIKAGANRLPQMVNN